MKKAVFFLMSAIFLTFAVSAFAEDQGFIQKLKSRFTKKPAQAAGAPKITPDSIKKETKPADSVPAPQVSNAPMQREYYLENIKKALEVDPGAANKIPDLKIIKDGNKVSYALKDIGLESLDYESLQRLFNSIMETVYSMRAEAVNEQMQIIIQAQQAQAQANQAQQTQRQVNQAQQAQAQARQAQQAQAVGRPAGPVGPNRR